MLSRLQLASSPGAKARSLEKSGPSRNSKVHCQDKVQTGLIRLNLKEPGPASHTCRANSLQNKLNHDSSKMMFGGAFKFLGLCTICARFAGTCGYEGEIGYREGTVK